MWPLSRSASPKHLLRILPGGKTLLRATYERATAFAKRVVVVTEQSQVEAAKAELPELADDDWIVEPARRGTAPCLALAASALAADDVMVSLHADHLIGDPQAFTQAVTAAITCANETGSLVTIGVVPTRPATGFGYIHLGEVLEGYGPPQVYRAQRFVEKPPAEEAERMVRSGDHLWNSGIFAWRNSTFLDQLSRSAPDLAAGAAAAAAARASGREDDYATAYTKLPEIAVDYAVMERTDDLAVVRGDFGWSDLGSYADLGTVNEPDVSGNVTIGDVLIKSGSGNLAVSDGRLLALVGVDHLVVVVTEDAVLVCPKDRAQDVKQLVAELRKRGREEVL